MMEISSLKLSEIAGFNFKCTFGKKHSVEIQKILLGSHIIKFLYRTI